MDKSNKGILVNKQEWEKDRGILGDIFVRYPVFEQRYLPNQPTSLVNVWMDAYNRLMKWSKEDKDTWTLDPDKFIMYVSILKDIYIKAFKSVTYREEKLQPSRIQSREIFPPLNKIINKYVDILYKNKITNKLIIAINRIEKQGLIDELNRKIIIDRSELEYIVDDLMILMINIREKNITDYKAIDRIYHCLTNILDR